MNPRKFLLVALEIRKLETGKAKDLSAPLRGPGRSMSNKRLELEFVGKYSSCPPFM
jgi:hypothetical protein